MPMPEIAHRVGRRGSFLLFLSLLDIVYAYSLFYPTPSSIKNPTSVFLMDIAPLSVWGTLWLVVGIICLIFAFRQNDAFGYGAAMTIKMVWGLTFLLGWIFAGVERGYISAAIWLVFAGVLALIATWPDDIKTAFRRE
jgi:hypothetical protein